MTIDSIQDEIIEEFSVFEDKLGSYEYIIELGKGLPIINPKFRTEQYVIKGCQSRVWLNADLVDGKVFFTADGDAVITKGIIALLIRVLSGRTPDEIINTELYFIDKIGLKEHLSLTRANGLVAMIKQMKLFALAFNSKLNS